MKLITDIEGARVSLDVQRDGERVVAEIGERRYELEASESGAGELLLICEGRVYECRVDAAGMGRGGAARIEVDMRGRTHHVKLFDPKRLGGAQSASAHGDGRAEVKAPMPGKIVRVLVEQNASVEQGDGLVVVEAMKMQNELKSPKTGTVVALHAEPGTTVNAGDLLVVIE